MTPTATTTPPFSVAGTPVRDDVAPARGRTPLVSEDWLAVLVGGALIALMLIGVRPAAAFLGAQGFNVFVTLVAAYAFFGGLLFALPKL